MATLFGMFPFLKTLFADSGYQGPKFAKALAKVLPHIDIEIVKRSDQVSGFVVLPKRWISATLDIDAGHLRPEPGDGPVRSNLFHAHLHATLVKRKEACHESGETDAVGGWRGGCDRGHSERGGCRK
jgi:hypothetical protein